MLIFLYFYIDEDLKFHAHLSWAWTSELSMNIFITSRPNVELINSDATDGKDNN